MQRGKEAYFHAGDLYIQVLVEEESVSTQMSETPETGIIYIELE